MSGKPVKLLEKGALAKGQKVGVSPSSGFLLVRFINRIAEYVSSAKLSLAGDLKGLKFAMIGDSYVRGNNIAMSATSFNIAAVDNGMAYANYGLNGNTVASFEGWTTAPMSERYENLLDGYDIIGFEGGRNDFNKNIPIGSDSDNTNTTFKGALNVLCKGMIKKYLGKKIFGMPCWALNTDENSAGATQNDYLEAFVHIVSDIWGIPVLDTRQTGVTMNSQDFLLRYTENGTSVSHLNRDGHVLFSRKISKFLLSL